MLLVAVNSQIMITDDHPVSESLLNDFEFLLSGFELTTLNLSSLTAPNISVTLLVAVNSQLLLMTIQLLNFC